MDPVAQNIFIDYKSWNILVKIEGKLQYLKHGCYMFTLISLSLAISGAQILLIGVFKKHPL